MKMSELLGIFGSYNRLIQVSYTTEKNVEKRSGIMKVGNVTFRHIDEWDFRKRVGTIVPAVDSRGRKFIHVRLWEEK